MTEEDPGTEITGADDMIGIGGENEISCHGDMVKVTKTHPQLLTYVRNYYNMYRLFSCDVINNNI